jgi:MYXO-CTERM domain-containing protein
MQRKFYRDLGWMAAAFASLTGAALLISPTKVEACGGFFCNSNRAIAVNQAAEQIIFSKNADGTVTAVIQIMYEGASTKFAWVLPVPGVPTVAVSSDQAFAALKQQTNPSYQLQYQFSNCPNTGFGLSPSASGAGGSAASVDAGARAAVTVEASGAIGPYDYDVISVNPQLSDRAQVAVDWLTMHEYDVGPMGADVLRPYLMDDLNLIAFKLTKGTSTGSIRPVMLTYDGGLPSIPIRPTAVAANDDMGVLVWVLSDARAIPENYKALELNEALIDWFNPNNNYSKVVSQAADEAMGQGFVTEFAGATTNFKQASGAGIFPQYQQQTWDQFSSAPHTDAMAMIRDATANWGPWDGFDDALTASVTLPSTIAIKDFKACLACYLTAPGVSFDTTKFLTQLYEKVIKPMAETQALFDAAPYITRLYTTMSAAEMTVDPAFDFNKDLGDVSNFHSATIAVGCGGAGPWQATLAQGVTVHGTTMGVWPVTLDSQPAALKILQYGKQGQGKVIEDRSDMVAKLLKDSAAASAGTGGTGGAGSSVSGTGGTPGTGGKGSTTMGTAGSPSRSVDAGSSNAGDGAATGAGTQTRSSGCTAANTQPSEAALLLFSSLAALFARRRRGRPD